jgi:hypothetical protein
VLCGVVGIPFSRLQPPTNADRLPTLSTHRRPTVTAGTIEVPVPEKLFLGIRLNASRASLGSSRPARMGNPRELILFCLEREPRAEFDSPRHLGHGRLPEGGRENGAYSGDVGVIENVRATSVNRECS